MFQSSNPTESFTTHDAIAAASASATHVLSGSFSGPGALETIKAINKSQQSGDLSQFGLDLDPFMQNYQSPNEGSLGKIWDGVKSLVGAEPTVADKLHDQAVAILTPAQKQEYDQEEAKMRIYETQMTLNPGTPPDMPMHDQVNQAVTQKETQIQQQVLNNMTPQQRQQLAQEEQTYAAGCAKAYSQINPLSDTMASPRLPAKGPTMQYFESMVQQQAQQAINGPTGS